MKGRLIIILLIFGLLLLHSGTAITSFSNHNSDHHRNNGSSSSSSEYNVLDYGAAGDGSTEDTNAFMQAWTAACKTSSTDDSPPTMVIPSNMTFLIRPVVFSGPCNSPNTNVQISGEITAPQNPSDWKCGGDSCKVWILFKDLTGLNLFGGGKIHGQGERWWTIKGHNKPTAMQIEDSNNVYVSNLTFIDNPRMHLVLNGLDTVYVNMVTIVAPETSPNTDGIHVADSTNVTIANCNIGTGDDCISIVDGSFRVRATNISCGPGHGVSIGSLGKNGADVKVEDIQIIDVVFTNTENGARIKTWQGGSGYARNILFDRIVSKDAENPIIIDQFYCENGKCKVQDSAVQIQDVTFRNITGTSEKEEAVILNCSKTVPCENIVAENIYILWENGTATHSSCSNVNGTIRGLQLPKVSCLTQL